MTTLGRQVTSLTRRQVLHGSLSGLAMPFVRPAFAADRQLFLRTPGGEYDDIMRKAIYEPFRQTTGITVNTVAGNLAMLQAMLQAGDSGLDVVDTTAEALTTLQRLNGLVPITYANWRFASPDDIIPEMRGTYRVANYAYAYVIAYDTQTFSASHHPQNWPAFWDLSTYPGPRTLPDITIGEPPIEFALLASGVPVKELYPLNLDAAFQSLTKIRSAIPKFWNSAALASQMLSDKEVVLAAVPNGRVQTLIDKGAALAIDWGQCELKQQAYGILKTGSNQAAAQLFVDFASQAKPQAEYARVLRYGPSNTKAYGLLPGDLVDILPGGPKSRETGYYYNSEWWADNLSLVNQRWASWIVE
jgi:putative spermidine/putrescine transport system substrate-binding protein